MHTELKKVKYRKKIFEKSFKRVYFIIIFFQFLIFMYLFQIMY